MDGDGRDEVTKARTGRARPTRPLWSAPSSVFVAVSRFTVRDGKQDEVERAFHERPHRVDDAEGFVSMEVLRGIDEECDFWLVTRWRDEQCFEDWHRGHTFKDSHDHIPAGLKLVPGRTELSRLRVVCT